jgi:hypothetical protein
MEQFDSIKKSFPPDDTPYRLAQELCHELKFEYSQFLTFIENAISNCQNNGQDVAMHFVQSDTDYQLSSYACYLIVEKLPIQDTEYHKKLKNHFYAKDFE